MKTGMNVVKAIADALKNMFKKIFEKSSPTTEGPPGAAGTAGQDLGTLQLIEELEEIQNKILEQSLKETDPSKLASLEMINDMNNSVIDILKDSIDPEKVSSMLPNERIAKMADDTTAKFLNKSGDKEDRVREELQGPLTKGEKGKEAFITETHENIDKQYGDSEIGKNIKAALLPTIKDKFDNFQVETPAQKVGVENSNQKELMKRSKSRELEREGRNNAIEESGPQSTMGGKGK